MVNLSALCLTAFARGGELLVQNFVAQPSAVPCNPSTRLQPGFVRLGGVSLQNERVYLYIQSEIWQIPYSLYSLSYLRFASCIHSPCAIIYFMTKIRFATYDLFLDVTFACFMKMPSAKPHDDALEYTIFLA